MLLSQAGQPGLVAVAHVEPASPVSPTYTPASQPPVTTNQIGSDFNTQDGFNVQWLLFILGFFFYIPSIVGAFLPLCQVRMMGKRRERGVGGGGEEEGEGPRGGPVKY